MASYHSETTTLIRDSASAVAPRGGDLARVRALRFQSPGFDPQIWREMAALGWIGLRLPEEKGGVGLGMTESIALYEELGHGIVPEPLIATTLAATLLAQSDEAELLGRLIRGEQLVTAAGVNSANISTSAAHDNAEAADMADAFILPELDEEALTLRLVARSDMTIETIALQDGGRVATVSAAPDSGRVIARNSGNLLRRAIDEAALGTAAYLLGVAESAFSMTIDYLKERRQFGQSLASFQALQHRAADLKIQLTLTRASVEAAAAELDAGADDTARQRAVSRAKARASDTALLAGREAIQLHGAIGYTDEYDVGLFLRKAMVLANHYGSAHAHRRRFAALTADR